MADGKKLLKKESPVKTPTSSKRDRGRPKGKGLKGTKRKVIVDYEGQDPRLEEHPDQRPDFEQVAETPQDGASSHKYPPPKKNPTFRKVWMQFIDSIARRENFNIGHLNVFEVFCELFVDYEDLRKFIRTHGRHYWVHGRGGRFLKPYPEIQQLERIQHQINLYMKQLGLGLKKDSIGKSGGEEDNWD